MLKLLKYEFRKGLTALLIMLAEIGVVLAVSRQARHEKE